MEQAQLLRCIATMDGLMRSIETERRDMRFVGVGGASSAFAGKMEKRGQ